jgi:hypothetical protein
MRTVDVAELLGGSNSGGYHADDARPPEPGSVMGQATLAGAPVVEADERTTAAGELGVH